MKTCAAAGMFGALCGLLLMLEARAASPAIKRLPAEELTFLREMTRDVVEASRVPPGSHGGGNWPITNSCGFTLLTPGKDTYKAVWVRDFSMALDSGFISVEEISNHLELICRVQNGPADRPLAHGLHLPPWAIPDHINYDGRAVWFPGTYESGDDQGDGTFGRLPPLDDHYEFVHIAFALFQTRQSAAFLQQSVAGVTVLERLENAFSSPKTDPESGLAETTESDRGVGFGFCDAEVHTGKLLFASLLRYRAAGELAHLARALGDRKGESAYLAAQQRIRGHILTTFADPNHRDGWLRASTGLSSQPDVWGTLYALHLNVLNAEATKSARRTVAEACKAGTISFEGAVRHVPTDRDFSKTTAWERSLSPVNTYQNGAYWHTATGWLIEALWPENRELGARIFEEMMRHLRSQDFRKDQGNGAPWETFGLDGRARQNAVYMASVALPFSILKSLPD